MHDVSHDEPVFFEAAGETLFGVCTHASGPRRRVGVVLIQGGDKVNAGLSRNHIGTRMARQLGADGYDVIRFAYHGVGESSGVVEEIDIHKPFVDDVTGAVRALRTHDVDSVVLVGVCFGARTALSTAANIPDIGGVVMVAPPSSGYTRTEAAVEFTARNTSVRTYVGEALSLSRIRGMFDGTKRRAYLRLAKAKLRQLARRGTKESSNGDYDWVSPMLANPLSQMVDQQVPVLLVFGEHDRWLKEFREAASGPLSEILARGEDSIEVIDDLPGEVNGLTRVELQEAFRELTVDWLHRRVPGSVPADAS